MSRNAAGRVALGALGWIAVGLAVAGAVIPGVPTTVFVLAAAWCFARSSPRFAEWLRSHSWLGRPLRSFSRSGGMPRSAKLLALGSMWPAIALSAFFLARVHASAALATVALGVLGTLAILLVVPTATESDN
jgi:uncharacterized membrane protein YbaN (DUF454 family)